MPRNLKEIVHSWIRLLISCLLWFFPGVSELSDPSYSGWAAHDGGPGGRSRGHLLLPTGVLGLRRYSNTILMHCKDKILKFWNKYSQKRNIGVSVPISTFMRLWAIYIFPRLVSLFCWRKYADWSWDYINRSQTNECWNWGWGRAIPRKEYIKGTFIAECDACWRNKKIKHCRGIAIK